MPPKCRFTRDEIIQAALDITRETGIQAVTARAVGGKLNSSSKVIFGLFQNMEELQAEVMKAAHDRYQDFLKEEMESGRYVPYKASGMAYIRFAREEKELFKLLFMRDRSREKISEDSGELKPLLALIRANTGMSEADAYLFHLEMWIYVHGIAAMVATGYLEWDWELISRMLTDSYEGIRTRFPAVKEGANGIGQDD